MATIVEVPKPGVVVKSVVEINGELTVSISWMGVKQVQRIIPITPGLLLYNPATNQFRMIPVEGLEEGEQFIQFMKEII